MKKMLLVDGNSLFFRAYYATAYTHITTTSFGQATNAVFGFANMLNKAIELVNPQAMVVAFDSGKKTFRHEAYKEYKGTRKELPQELISQFPLVREYCASAGYCYYQQDGLEADDIIGSLVKRYPDWDINVLSSDKDLLQLIDKTTSVWLIKKGLTQIEEMDEAALMTSMNLKPEQICDLKGLMGDPSDNIPGLPGVGEKTALKLLADYYSVEGVIEHVEELKGKLKETVLNQKDLAIFSKWLATIKTDGDIDLNLEQSLFNPTPLKANDFFVKYEMRSLVKALETPKEKLSESIHFKDLDKKVPLAIVGHYRLDSDWPHPLFGLAFSDGKESCFIRLEDIQQDAEICEYLKDTKDIITLEVKSLYHAQTEKLIFNQQMVDVSLLAFIEDSSLNSYEKMAERFNWPSSAVAINDEANQDLCRELALKLHQTSSELIQSLEDKDVYDVYRRIDYPMIDVLYEMEKEGFLVDASILNDIAESTLIKINRLTESIYALAGQSFNINSPKQLADLLFDTLNLTSNRKRSTSIDVLESLVDEHPIIVELMEYRKYQKLYSTYAIGLSKFIQSDSKIHTAYNLTTAQTGRLSSSDPNLQNISVRDEESRSIRKAFIPHPNHVLLACDYSQIELRVLAHMAHEEALIEAFKTGLDIHTKTAMDVFGLQENQVDAQARRSAKAVNFGIIYGISDFGLATQIGSDRKSAKAFIERYLSTYSGISRYMNDTIAFCEEKGYVETLFRRRRELPDIHNKAFQVREFAKRASMNAPIQGTAADIMKLAMIDIHQKMKDQKFKAKMIVQVHDELVFDCPKDELEALKELVVDSMENAVMLEVPLKVSVEVGNNWYEAK